MTFDHEPAGYQVCLCVGLPPAEMQASRGVDITPAAPTAEAMIAAIRTAGIEASDLRAKTLLSLDCDAATAALAYAAVVGFAGRRVDVLVAGTLIQSELLYRAGIKMQQPRPAASLECVLVGAVHEGIRSIVLDRALADESAAVIRWARRLRFVPNADPVQTISQLIVVSALRHRTTGDRLPLLCDGTEPAPASDAPLDPVGIDLDDVRAEALSIRRSVRSGDRDAVADTVEPSLRRQRLAVAASLPIEETLVRLGARQNEDTDLWHCPRPERHSHGDATASMRIQRGRVRCYRCDAERVDSLRLTMDARGLSVDEAADWLLATPAA